MPLTPSPSPDAYAARRDRIAGQLRAEQAVLVLHGGRLRTRSNDTEFRFRPDSDFHYLTGLAEPGSVMVLRPVEDGHELTLFVRPRDAEAEVWSGRRIGPEGARERFGASTAHPISTLNSELPKLLDGCKAVYLPLGRDSKFDAKVIGAAAALRRRNRWGETPPANFADARALVGEDRMHKDLAALESLRTAIDISARAHVAAMRRVRPGMFEYEIEALIEYEFRRAGSSGPGYASIVGAGDNATILHYIDNQDRLDAGQVLLVDAGCEWDLFSGDITRSYPVSGKFSGEQRALYDVVLTANEAGISDTIVGNDIDSIHARCIRILSEGIHDLGLIDASVDEIEDKELFKRFYMHRTSHWLGADVHDAGHYTIDRDPRPLEAGFVLTIEPGLYIAASDDTVPEGFRGIGIRIEDDVLVTDSGPEVLTKAVPKHPDEIESIVGSG